MAGLEQNVTESLPLSLYCASCAIWEGWRGVGGAPDPLLLAVCSGIPSDAQGPSAVPGTELGRARAGQVR